MPSHMTINALDAPKIVKYSAHNFIEFFYPDKQTNKETDKRNKKTIVPGGVWDNKTHCV